jgi:hypothetical protein
MNVRPCKFGIDITVRWNSTYLMLKHLILSILARNVIYVPISTISSESAFSLCGRIIEERRRRLAPEMVESFFA